MNTRVFNKLLEIDKKINYIFGGLYDETISARAYRRYRDGSKVWSVIKQIIDFIIFWEEDHCMTSFRDFMWRRGIKWNP